MLLQQISMDISNLCLCDFYVIYGGLVYANPQRQFQKAIFFKTS